jgi:hypothetical protein
MPVTKRKKMAKRDMVILRFIYVFDELAR